MIRLFGATDNNFSTNGDIVINALKAIVHCEDNGAFYLELETDLSYSDYIVENNIIVAPTPQGDQAFRVGNVRKTGSKITTRAYHVFYDSKNYLIEDSYVFEKNCNDALNHLNRATSDWSPFTVWSDVPTVANYRCVRSSLYEAINTVLDRWGGHLVRDNWNVIVKSQIGSDSGAVIRYAKNLKDISSEENWDDVVTRLLPVGKDGILLNAVDATADLYVYSSVRYAVPYTKKINFSQDNVLEEDYQDSGGNLDEVRYKAALVEDLRAKAVNYVNLNCVPKVNYTLKANLDEVSGLGDRIAVIDERLGINVLTFVISYEYDCILNKYSEIEFGNFLNKLSDLISNIENRAAQEAMKVSQESTSNMESALNEAIGEVWETLRGSYIVYEGDRVLALDRLPKESAVNVFEIGNSGISFSNTGINGEFTKVWSINGTLDMGKANVINLTSDLINGGVLKQGGNLDSLGQTKLYDKANKLIAELTADGIKFYGIDSSFVLVNKEVGAAGFNRLLEKVFWWDNDGINLTGKVSLGETVISDKFKISEITLTDTNNAVTSDGIGITPLS